MPDLIAQGPELQQRWRRTVPEDHPVVLGRTAGNWAVPWDAAVSRRHLTMRWNGQRLEVMRLPEARNPIYYSGREADRFAIGPGEHFVVGETTFTLADQRADVSADLPAPLREQAFSAQYLKQIPFRHPDRRLEVLSRLPEVIGGAAGENELCVRLVSMLLAGVPRADAAAVVAAERESSAAPRVLQWDQRLAVADDFRPSVGLIREAISRGQSVLHVWRGPSPAAPQSFTANEQYDWAFCTPVGGAGTPWALYVAGRFAAETALQHSTDPTDLREDVKFTELAAAMLGALRHMRLLERRHATLSPFFSPVVLETLMSQDPDEVLAPRETDVCVMFCDLRGFSRESERQSRDLMGLLNRVSNALGIATRQIRQQGGVVGDFQGDAAMGFWGWPLPQPDMAVRAAAAALDIRRQFEATANFRAGIGIAAGRAVAGKIGTVDQVKVTVFGPVVNLASRLEGMTKVLRAPILIDRATATAVRRSVPASVARVRRLAVVRPYGVENALEVSELLPPAGEESPLTDEHIAIYESALDAFLASRWSEALDKLQRIPAADQAKDFLTAAIVQHNRTPPPGWDGVIPLQTK